MHHASCRVNAYVMADSPGRSGKTSAIVIAAKMRARRRRKCFPHETGWLAWKWMCRREHRFVYKCKDICWQKTNLLTKKIFWQTLLTKTKSADSKNLLTKSADKNKICWQETSSDKICLRKENLLVMENSWRIWIHSTRYLRQKCVSSSGSAYSPKINYV